MFKKRYIVVFIVMVIFILIVTGNEKESEITYESITIDEMYEIIDEGIIVDVRTNEEYQVYNIEGSINIPLDEINTITDSITNKDAQIFVYCASGVRSNEAAETLISLGYTNVYDMGGLYS